MPKFNLDLKISDTQRLKLEEMMEQTKNEKFNDKNCDKTDTNQIPIQTNDDWFAIQVDRDFLTGLYGEGIQLYFTKNIKKYYILKKATFEDNVLTVYTKCGKAWSLLKEPDNETFENTIYQIWKRCDELYFKGDENRTDYEPWALNSIQALAIEMNALRMYDVLLYYKKIHLS